ncbi:MAG: BlaI/MecI/CopY family transcriptional regulator [Candidatus Latescibacterota bacterium]
MRIKRKALSGTERLLMQICWEKGPATARDIHEATLKEKRREYQTVKTMLDRMVEKRYLIRRKFGPVWLYEPALTREDFLRSEMETLAETVLENNFAPLFVNLAKKEKLSREEIDALRELLKKHEGEL